MEAPSGKEMHNQLNNLVHREHLHKELHEDSFRLLMSTLEIGYKDYKD